MQTEAELITILQINVLTVLSIYTLLPVSSSALYGLIFKGEHKKTQKTWAFYY